MDFVVFSIRAEFYHYHDWKDPSWSSKPVEKSTDYAGSMTKEDCRAVVLPRIGERLYHGMTRFEPYTTVETVEHRFAPLWISAPDDGSNQRDDGPWVTLVTHQRCPGPGEMEQFVREFEKNGWEWLDDAVVDAARVRLESPN
jgi:hypothetical protein